MKRYSFLAFVWAVTAYAIYDMLSAGAFAPLTYQTAWDRTFGIVGMALAIAAVVIAAVLATLRPGIMTLCLLLPLIDLGNDLSTPWPVLNFVSTVLSHNGLWVLLVIFAVRFPEDHVSGWRAVVERAGIVAFVAMEATVIVSAIPILSGGRLVFSGAEKSFYVAAGAVAMFFTSVILLVRLTGVSPAERIRLRWAFLGAAAGATGLAFYGVIYAMGAETPADVLIGVTIVFLPASAAYALLRTRFTDPVFLLNRATVYAVTVAFLSVVIGGIDFLTGKFLSSRGVALVLEAAISIGLGFTLTTVRRRIETLVEGTLFRRRHEASEFLRRLGTSLPLASSEEPIHHALAVDAPRELELTSAALFRYDSETQRYVRRASCGWEPHHVSTLDAEDPLVRFLMIERQPLRTHDARWQRDDAPRGLAAPALAVPVLLRGRVAAFVLYGIHADHSDIDSTETAEIVTLAERSAAALDHVESHALRTRLAEMQAIVARLELPTTA